MTNPFATPEDLLQTKKNYHLPDSAHYGDDFFIDKKYQGSVARLLVASKTKLAFLILMVI